MSVTKIVCLIFSSTLLCACGVTSKEFKAAEELCKNNGGVSYVWVQDNTVNCNDGAQFSGKKVQEKINEIKDSQK